jgi:hypothetical protein
MRKYVRRKPSSAGSISTDIAMFEGVEGKVGLEMATGNGKREMGVSCCGRWNDDRTAQPRERKRAVGG